MSNSPSSVSHIYVLSTVTGVRATSLSSSTASHLTGGDSRPAGKTDATHCTRQLRLFANAPQHAHQRINGEFLDLVVDHIGHPGDDPGWTLRVPLVADTSGTSCGCPGRHSRAHWANSLRTAKQLQDWFRGCECASFNPCPLRRRLSHHGRHHDNSLPPCALGASTPIDAPAAVTADKLVRSRVTSPPLAARHRPYIEADQHTFSVGQIANDFPHGYRQLGITVGSAKI